MRIDKSKPDNRADNLPLPGKFADHATDFYLKEYEGLRKEIELVQNAISALERYVVVAVGVSWAWLYHEELNVPRLAWLIPCLFAVLGALRAFGYHRFFRAAHKYICTVEGAFSSDDDPGGFERSTPHRNWTSHSNWTFWGLLIISTVLVAVFEFRTL